MTTHTHLTYQEEGVQESGVQQVASDPISPTGGQLWINTTTNELKTYDGSAIVRIGAGVTGLQGDTGVIGPTGAYGGPQGVTGIQGVTGYAGTTGLQGPQGNTGVMGTTGYEGVQGVTGISGVSSEYEVGDGGATYTINWTNGASQAIILNDNLTLTLTNPFVGGAYILRLVQTTGGQTVTWPSSVIWPGGATPVLSTGAGLTDMVSLYFDGTYYYGTYALGYPT